MTGCLQCGQENRAEARFCDSCGAPLIPSPARREERKVVSVLFADLVDFTATAESLDPEDVRAVQEPYWRHVRAEIERHGGAVEKFIGDAVVGLFGAPVAHEDDPERAVRAALVIRDWAREQEEIQVRIGITTGAALVRLDVSPLGGEGIVSGDVINTASRLQTAAPPNGILVDDPTRRATGETIDYAEADPLTAKGKAAPVQVWTAVEARSRFGVDVIQHTRAPLVGRVRELDVLKDALARVRVERSPLLVTLVGVPGIGKSRLVYELMRAVEADHEIVTWRQGRSLPYGDGVSFSALGETIKAQAGILETDLDTEAGHKLGRAVRALVDDRAEAEWVELHLRPLVGLAGRPELTSDRVEAFAAWRRFFEALADRRPAVLVFEDLHWADDGLLDFIENVIEWVRDAPLLVVATARPELFERRRTWAGGKPNATTLSLSPLSSDETARLVGQLVNAADIAPESRRMLVERAAGNALYAEQYARMWQERTADEELSPPETVQAVISARLDALSPEEKSLLHNAAVIGKVFWAGAVIALEGPGRDDLTDCLHTLERKEFVQRARRSSVEGENEYAFRHVLVRDVAYNQIPRAARAEKHGRAAAWIQSVGRPEDHAETLAHHCLAAFELARTSGGPGEAHARRARSALAQAGHHGLAVNAFPSAVSYFERALDLTPDTDPARPELLLGRARALFECGTDDGRVQALAVAIDALVAAGDAGGAAEAEALLASVWWIRGQRERADRHLAHALALVDDQPASHAKARVLAEAARLEMVAGLESDRAIALAHDALALTDSLRLPIVQADVLITLGVTRVVAGDARGVADVERGLAIALDHNALRTAARGYANLANITENVTRERELLGAAEKMDRRLGDEQRLRYTRASLAHNLADAGRLDEALELANAFIAECESGNPHYAEPWVRARRAVIQLGRDQADAAVDDIEQAIAIAREVKDPQSLYGTLGSAARVYVEIGRTEDAHQIAEEMLAAGSGVARISYDFVLVAHRLAVAEQLRQAFGAVSSEKRWDSAAVAYLEQRISEAAQILDELGAVDDAAYVRLRGTDALHAQGQSLAALASDLEQALVFYHSVGATRYIREAEQLCAAISREREEAAQPQA